MIMTDRFLKLGYIWPQRDIPIKALEGVSKKLAQKLFDQGVFGYVTVLLTITSSGSSNRNFKVCVDRVIPYYDEFMSEYEMINSMVQPTAMQDMRTTAVIIPRIQNLKFSSDTNYLKFFERCRERNIQFDLKTKTGILFKLYGEIERGCLGMMSIGRIVVLTTESDKEQAVKSASRALSNIATLFAPDHKDDSDYVKCDIITYSMMVEFLYGMQKQS